MGNEHAVAIHQAQPSQDSTALISVIERIASNPDADIEKLERMLDMQERVMKRNAEVAFNAAMARMQAELPTITEKGEIRHNGQLRSKYAKFEDINEAVKPIMTKHGFAMTFKVNTADSVIRVTGILVHQEGHREETEMVLPVDASGSKNAVQAVGSSVSYGKRYVMSALLNLTTGGEDDDATGTVQRITEEQAANLDALIAEVGAKEEQFCRYMNVKHIGEIQVSQYDKAVAALERKRKETK